MSKVAVTGASGHIGANLVRELLNRGYEVVALVRETERALEGLDVRKVNGDLMDIESLRRAFTGAEYVYHSAAYISIRDNERDTLESVNVKGTANVLSACQQECVSTLVYFSTIHVLEQGPAGEPVTEQSPLAGVAGDHSSDYDHSKVRAEELVRACRSDSLTTRVIYPTAVLGPNDFNLSLFGQAILKMAQGSLPALVAGGFDWVDVRDVAWGAVEAAEKGADGDRFILSGHFLMMPEVAGVIAALTGVAAPRLTSPLWLARLFAPVLESWATISRTKPLYTRMSLSTLTTEDTICHSLASQKLGYRPRSFRASMYDALRDYSMQHGISLKDKESESHDVS
jgi:dihydroflavonol-4-reductase